MYCPPLNAVISAEPEGKYLERDVDPSFLFEGLNPVSVPDTLSAEPCFSVDNIEEVGGIIDELFDAEVPCVSGDIVAASRISENRLVVPVYLGTDNMFLSIIDSGAQHSAVHIAVVERLGVPMIPVTNRCIRGFGVDDVVPVLGECNLTVTMHNHVMLTCKFIVLDTDVIKRYPVLLATDFLLMNSLTVSMNRRRISRHYESGVVWEYYVSDLDLPNVCVMNFVPCRAADTVTALPGKSVEVPVYLDLPSSICSLSSVEDEGFLFEGRISDVAKYFHPGIMGSKETCRTVLLSNQGVSPTSVRPGEIVGLLFSVVDVSAVTEASGEVLSLASDEPDESLQQVVFGDHLSNDEQGKVRIMLESQRDVFSRGATDVGCLGVTPHRIELYNYTPIYQKPRRFPEVVNEEIERQCRELELLDIIESSTSPWSSPVVPIRKKDNTIRLCIDYRRLNDVMKPDKHPLPNLSDAVFGLSGVRFFTTLDLVRGYYQLPLDEESRELTAFSTARAHWQFKRLSFGLKNAPAGFQREMQHILSSFSWRKVIVYIDDVLIMSETFVEHLQLVSKVLSVLRAHGVKVKVSKCRLFEREVQFLGHVVSREGLSKPKAYIEAINEFALPETVRQLRSFLGLVNFQRKFVPNCSVIMKPLSVLTGGRASAKIKWTDEMVEAFNALKTKMKDDVCLSFPDYSPEALPLELYTDASALGVGACLCQSQSGTIRRIAYASMAFSLAQKNYSTLERELAAIRWAVKVFRPFLFGVDFIIHTDHQPLVYLQNMKIVNSRLARTLEDLSDFSFIIRYTPGQCNTAADALSRVHVLPESEATEFTGEYLPAGLSRLRVLEGGGNSLIQSLLLAASHLTLLRPLPARVTELREFLVAEMLKSTKLYFPVGDKHLISKLKLMMHDGQLLCEESLVVFGKLFGCVVLVHHGGDVPVTYADPKVAQLSGLVRVHLQCLVGIHYNPVVELSTYRAPELLLDRSLPISGDVPYAPDTLLGGVDEDDDFHIASLFESSVTINCLIHVDPLRDSSVVLICRDRPFCALLDTGAQLSCVSSDVLASLSVMLDHSNCQSIRGVGDCCTRVLGSVLLDISFGGGSSFVQRFAVVGENAMPFCFILGADCLTVHSVDLDYARMCCCKDETVLPFRKVKRGDSVLNYIGLADGVTEICVGSPEVSVYFGAEHCSDDLPRLPGLFEEEDVRRIQRKDRQLSSLRRQILRDGLGKWPGNLQRFKRYSKSLSVEKDIVVFRSSNTFCSYVVPFSLLVEVSLVLHRQMAHLGRQKLLAMVSEHIWHPSLSKVVGDVTRSCDFCQKVKVAPTIQPPITKVITRIPFELVAVDLISFPPTRRGHIGCLVAVDHNSKWMNAIPIKSKTGVTVANAMNVVLQSFPRVPSRVLSDNGPEFRSAAFNEVLDNFGIQHVYSTPYKPSSNGLVERGNRTLTELFRNLSTLQGGWDDDLTKAVIVYNSTVHSEHQMSPSQYLLCRKHDFVTSPSLPADEVSRWREGNPAFLPFIIGQKVLRKVEFKGRLVVDKFSDRFEGPFVISKINPNKVTYWIRAGDGTESRAHHIQLRVYHEPPNYILTHPYFVTSEDSCDDFNCNRVVDALVPDDSNACLGFICPSSGSTDDFDDASVSLTSLSSEFLDSSGSSQSQCSKFSKFVQVDFLEFNMHGGSPDQSVLKIISDFESKLHSSAVPSGDFFVDYPDCDFSGFTEDPSVYAAKCLNWSVSDITIASCVGDVCPSSVDSDAISFRNLMKDVLVNLEDIEKALALSSPFLGFSDAVAVPDTVIPSSSFVKSPLFRLSPELSDGSGVSVLSQCQFAQDRLVRLRDAIVRECPANADGLSAGRLSISEPELSLYHRPVTRSRGDVIVYPTVQSRILEYRRRDK